MRAYHARPNKRDVQRIAARVARAAGVEPDHLFTHLYERRIVALREAAQVRILRETKCSMNGLAYVWGCDLKSIQRAVEKARARVKRRPPMDDLKYAQTVRFLYPERADAMLAGTDPKMNADLAHWDQLGQRSAA